MDPTSHRPHPRSRTLLFAVVAAAVLVACGLPSCNPTAGAQLTICAVDSAQKSDCSASAFAAHSIIAGDIRTVSSSQVIAVQVLDAASRQPMPNLPLRITIGGANASTADVQSDSTGMATFTYIGTHPGTDTISVAPTSGATVRSATTATIHWLKTQSVVHPILFVHGINENANVLQRQEEWTTLFEALDATYERTDIETFCFVDDRAYRDASAPPHCPGPTTADCATKCISQSSVDDNAVELAKRVMDFHTRIGKPVTLMGYSMGSAIIRTFLAGCPNSPTQTDADANGRADVCEAALPFVDQAYFLNGVQQGSWLMTVKQGVDDASNLTGDGISPFTSLAFHSVLPVLEQFIFDTVKDRLGGPDPTSQAAIDLTPQSSNIQAHNRFPIPSNIQVYTFYGSVQLTMSVDIFAYHVAGTQTLPLGDLVLLAQSDSLASTPRWGGASLCDACSPPDAHGYHASSSGDQYHAWALIDAHDVNIADIIPAVGQTLQATAGSPVQHLNISQPVAQAPGSGVQVEDITHLSGNPTTDMAYEILLILMHHDGLA
jgi:pimeloyl-ACP methyl ester carboxylesterase